MRHDFDVLSTPAIGALLCVYVFSGLSEVVFVEEEAFPRDSFQIWWT